jgi:hypothetical protein
MSKYINDEFFNNAIDELHTKDGWESDKNEELTIYS